MQMQTTTKRERNPETGMVYRGACDLVHIADGERAEMGVQLAYELDSMMRQDATDSGSLDFDAAYGRNALPLCPGCYMVALVNAAVTLATDNGQPLRELAQSMADAFQALADGGESRMESIAVALDHPA